MSIERAGGRRERGKGMCYAVERGRGGGGQNCVGRANARHRNKGEISSTKMQDYLPKSETVDHRDPDEWRYSRTADRHGDVLVHVELLRLQRAAHDQLVSRMPVINLTTNPPLRLMQFASEDSSRRRGE